MIEKKRLLLVDDDKIFSKMFSHSFNSNKYDVDMANTFEQAVAKIKDNIYDAYMIDIDLNSPKDGFFLGDIIKTRNQNASIIIISNTKGEHSLIRTLEHKFDHFFTKSTEYHNFAKTIEEILESIPKTKNQNIFHDIKKYGIITENTGVIKILSQVINLKESTNILIEGESGTGKELMARYIGSILAPNGPFVTVNCPATPITLMESILFGHTKGAFTGADRESIGKFGEAEGGVIFLDEISCANMDMQKKLLRVIQNQEIERVGSVKKIKCNVKIIASTNENLQNKILKNEFREDLFFRLRRHAITLPPLRERLDDIELLINHFAKNKKDKFTKEVITVLKSYSWPGNIRELENLVYDLLVKTEDKNKIILKDVLHLFTTFTSKASVIDPISGKAINEGDFIACLREKAKQEGLFNCLKSLEKQIIREELNACKNLSECSRNLKLDPSGLSKRIRKYNLK